jgi:DNA-binding transcriptional MerR regulator
MSKDDRIRAEIQELLASSKEQREQHEQRVQRHHALKHEHKQEHRASRQELLRKKNSGLVPMTAGKPASVGTASKDSSQKRPIWRNLSNNFSNMLQKVVEVTTAALQPSAEPANKLLKCGETGGVASICV